MARIQNTLLAGGKIGLPGGAEIYLDEYGVSPVLEEAVAADMLTCSGWSRAADPTPQASKKTADKPAAAPDPSA